MIKYLFELAITTTGVVATRALSVVIAILIARLAGAETFGEYSIFITIFVIASEVPNAIDTTFIRFSNKPGNEVDTDIYLATGLVLKLFYIVFLLVLAGFFSHAIAVMAFNNEVYSKGVCYSLVTASFICLFYLLVSRFQQKKHFGLVALLRPVYLLLVLVSFGVSLFLNIDLTSGNIFGLYVYVSFFLGLVSFVFILRAIRGWSGLKVGIVGYLRVASVLMLSSLMVLVSNRMDLLFLASFISVSEVGEYGAAVRVSVILSVFTAAITTLYIPRASKAVENYQAYRKYLDVSLMYSLLLTILAYFIYLLVEHIVIILFGAEYSGIEIICVILLFQVLFETYARSFQALIQCGPKPGVIVIASFVRLCVVIGALYYLVPKYGSIGGALSVAISSAIVGILLYFLARIYAKPSVIT